MNRDAVATGARAPWRCEWDPQPERAHPSPSLSATRTAMVGGPWSFVHESRTLREAGGRRSGLGPGIDLKFHEPAPKRQPARAHVQHRSRLQAATSEPRGAPAGPGSERLRRGGAVSWCAPALARTAVSKRAAWRAVQGPRAATAPLLQTASRCASCPWAGAAANDTPSLLLPCPDRQAPSPPRSWAP